MNNTTTKKEVRLRISTVHLQSLIEINKQGKEHNQPRPRYATEPCSSGIPSHWKEPVSGTNPQNHRLPASKLHTYIYIKKQNKTKPQH